MLAMKQRNIVSSLLSGGVHDKYRAIERAIEQLPPGELAKLRRWFLEFDAAAWEAQIETDAAAGKFDALAEERRRKRCRESFFEAGGHRKTHLLCHVPYHCYLVVSSPWQTPDGGIASVVRFHRWATAKTTLSCAAGRRARRI
jgi:hypothetical protein